MKHIKCLFGFHTFKEKYNSGENCVHCHEINKDKAQLDLFKRREGFLSLKPKVMAKQFLIDMYDLYNTVCYFHPHEFERPNRFYLRSSPYGGLIEVEENHFKDMVEKWGNSKEQMTDFDKIMFKIYNMKDKDETIDKDDAYFSDKVVNLIEKYEYVLNSINDILDEAKEYDTKLSKEVSSKIATCIVDTLSDIYKCMREVEEERKKMKEMLDDATNKSFLKRLDLEDSYIEKIKGGA